MPRTSVAMTYERSAFSDDVGRWAAARTLGAAAPRAWGRGTGGVEVRGECRSKTRNGLLTRPSPVPGWNARSKFVVSFTVLFWIKLLSAPWPIMAIPSKAPLLERSRVASCFLARSTSAPKEASPSLASAMGTGCQRSINNLRGCSRRARCLCAPRRLYVPANSSCNSPQSVGCISTESARVHTSHRM